jgi:hypothetical protein
MGTENTHLTTGRLCCCVFLLLLLAAIRPASASALSVQAGGAIHNRRTACCGSRT